MKAISAISVFVALLLGCPFEAASGQAEDQRREIEIWAQASPAILSYMSKSAGAVADGYKKAHKKYIYWYINYYEPERRYDAPVEVILKYMFENIALSAAQYLIPYQGVFAVDLLKGTLQDGYQEIAHSLHAGHPTEAQVMTRVEDRLDTLVDKIEELPTKFELEYPNQFEEAMLIYTEEELQTPNIHINSRPQYLGPDTRSYLDKMGFPEPTKHTRDEVAEPILTQLIYETLRQTYQTEPFMTQSQMRLDARINARQLLFPEEPARYCEDAWLLGMHRPQECWQFE